MDKEMDKDFGGNFVTIEDEDGEEYELEHIDTLELDGQTYMAFLPADMDEDDEDYGFVILKVVVEDGEELFASVDGDGELDRVYERFMEQLFDEDD